MRIQQAGKKKGGVGEGIFARLPSREAGLGWERLRSLTPSREAKQNIFQILLEEKGSRAKIEKREECFALRRRQAGGAAGRGCRGHYSKSRIFDKVSSSEILEYLYNKVRTCFMKNI